MRAEPDSTAGRSGRWLTSGLCALAFMAVANLAIAGVRAAATGTAPHWSIRLGVGTAAALLLPLLALARLRQGPREEAAPAELTPGDPRLRTARHRWLRRAQWLLGPVLIGVALVSISGQWDTVTDGVAQLAHLHWRYVRLAVYAEALSAVAFSLLWWVLVRGRGARLALRSVIGLTLASNALTVSMPAGQAVAATFSFDQLRRRGLGRRDAAHVVISSAVLVAAGLVLILALGVELAGGHGPAAPFRIVVEVVSAAVVLAAAVLIMTRRIRWPSLAPEPRVLLAALGAGLGNWIADFGCFVAAILAAGGHLRWSAVLAVYAVGQVAAALPITPGGLGIMEGALSVLLVAYGMHASTAVAAVLLYRIVSFWLLVPIGLAIALPMQLGRRRRAARAKAAAPAEVAPVPAAT